MQQIPWNASPRGSERRSGLGLTVMAAVLLSFGVGAATAAFALVSSVSRHSVPLVACESMLQLTGSQFAHASANVPTADEVQARVTEAYRETYDASYSPDYEASFERAGDVVGSWSEVAESLDGRWLAPLFAAGALAMLVACARGAAHMLTAPRARAVAAVSAVGALFVSAMLLGVLGLPMMGLRSVAFAICVSMLAVKFAQRARNDLLPAA
jgi:hypothetical protein